MPNGLRRVCWSTTRSATPSRPFAAAPGKAGVHDSSPPLGRAPAGAGSPWAWRVAIGQHVLAGVPHFVGDGLHTRGTRGKIVAEDPETILAR